MLEVSCLKQEPSVRSKSKMFPFITRTWNPIVGCPHQCKYCWAWKYANRLNLYKLGFTMPQFFPERLNHPNFKDDDFVFVSDMGDAWAKCVPYVWQQKMVLGVIEKHLKTTFLLLTKDPHGYVRFYRNHGLFPENVVLGMTVETNRSTKWVSFAPTPFTRFKNFKYIPHGRKFISIEPIMGFDYSTFLHQILSVHPYAVAVGYDNYHNKLPEPTLAKTTKLLLALRMAGITVFEKTIREADSEC